MVQKICDLNGPGTNSMEYGIYGTDLLIPYPSINTPNLIGFVGGDSFKDRFLKGDWRSPIILFAYKNDLSKWIYSIGGNYARQILDYVHHNAAGETTRLPTDIIPVKGKLYLHYMVIGKGGLKDCRWTGISVSDDDGHTWRDSGARWNGTDYWGCAQMNTWCDGEDGWLYVMKARGLARDSNVFLFRVRPEKIADPAAYEARGFDPTTRTWKWGGDPWAILPDGVRAGELSLRKIEGKYVLCMFRADAGCIELRMVDNITDNWHTAPSIRPITAMMVPQLYGGYIVPGSTLRDMKIVVSQWVTGRDDPYKAMLWGGISMFASAFVDPFAAARQRLADFLARFKR